MIERGIIMSAPMVLACIREAKAPGTGKTETRRLPHAWLRCVCSVPPRSIQFTASLYASASKGRSEIRRIPSGDCGHWFTWTSEPMPHQGPAATPIWIAEPIIQPGDRLWVRETWQTGAHYGEPRIAYRADSDCVMIDAWDGPDEGAGPSFNYDRCPGAHWSTWLTDLIGGREGSWRSPLHMPRWAARLVLTVTDVRLERLHDITEAGAIAEGVGDHGQAHYLAGCRRFEDDNGLARGATCLTVPGVEPYTARWAYWQLWNELHGGKSWDANPDVIVIAFKPELLLQDGVLPIDKPDVADDAESEADWP